jgi:hypothetical protein
MEITSKNFVEKLPLIEASIDDALFVAIDGEFTGLSCKDEAIGSLDTPAERYAKVKQLSNGCIKAELTRTLKMGDHGFGLFISFFGAWRPRPNLGIKFELTILYFFDKKHLGM